jgi:hypothetical protein
MTEPKKPIPIPPFIAWMSRHGIKVIGALVLLEFAFHGFTYLSAKRRDAAVAPAAGAGGADVIP